MQVEMQRSGLQDVTKTTLASHDLTSDRHALFSPILATHLDPCNPFISYYALKGSRPHELGDSLAEGTTLPKKQEVIHANFVRAAKVLLRRTNVDRERLAWVEYWLGAREEALHVTDVSTSALFSNAVKADGEQNMYKTKQSGGLADIEERHAERPDIRDMWDLIEDRVSIK